MDNNIHFGLRINELLQEKNISKTEAAELLGYTLTGFLKVLGKEDLNTEILKKTCNSLQVDMAYFLGGGGTVTQSGKANLAGSGNVQYKGSNNSINSDSNKMDMLRRENEHLKEQNQLLKEMVEILKTKS